MIKIRELLECIEGGISRALSVIPTSFEDKGFREPRWKSFSWQRAKRIIARSIAYCICRNNCTVYLLEMHGGEPSEDMGGKDVDIAIDCISGEEALEIEKELEKLLVEKLREKLGVDPYRYLDIPNIVEVHSANEYIIKKHVEAGPPYSIKLC